MTSLPTFKTQSKQLIPPSFMTKPTSELSADELIGKLHELRVERDCLRDDYEVLCHSIRRKFDTEHEDLTKKIEQVQAALDKFTNN
jgi:hypothetical protein